MSPLLLIKCYRSQFAAVCTSVSYAASAEICNNMPRFRTFITCNAYDLYHIRIVSVSAKGNPDSFSYYGPVLVNTAAHRILTLLDDFIGNFIENHECIIASPCLPCQFHQHFVFQFLYICVKYSHSVFLHCFRFAGSFIIH